MKQMKQLVVFMFVLMLSACENVPSTPQAFAFDSLRAAGAAIDSYRRDVESAKIQGSVNEAQWTSFAVKYNKVNDAIIQAAEVVKMSIVLTTPMESPSTPEINALLK